MIISLRIILDELIFISSGGSKQSTVDFLNESSRFGVENVELSSGQQVNVDEIIKLAKKTGLLIQPHNYFPPQKNNFVINLAKPNIETDLYFNQLLESQILIAKNFRRNYLHFHAGYCVDLKPKDLGSENLNLEIIDKDRCKSIFLKNIKYINNILNVNGLNLLIENNVLNSAVYRKRKLNPFLCCDPNEILELLSPIASDAKLLLDLAHLKVSAKTLGFNFMNAVERLAPITRAIHISDNDGARDSNDIIDEKSDVLQALKYFDNLNFITVEVYTDDFAVLQDQVKLVKKMRSIKC